MEFMSKAVVPQPSAVALFLSIMEQLRVDVVPTEEDTHFKVNGRTVVLHTRSLPSSNERLLEPIVLHALRQRAHEVNDDVMLVIAVPRLPSAWQQLVDQVKKLMGGRLRHEDDLGGWTIGRWAIVSERGGYIINDLPGIGSSAKDDLLTMNGARLAAAVIPLMKDPRRSDLTMCVLKLLLARAIQGSDVWFNSHSLSFTTTSAMAKTLEISESAAYGIISDLQSRGWVMVDKKRGPVLLKIHDIAEWWLTLAKVSRRSRVTLRSLYPSKRLMHASERLEWLRQQSSARGCHWAVNGWTACDLHQQSFLINSEKKPCSIALVGSIAHLAQAWELAICDEQDDRAILQVEVVEHARSVLIGMLTIDGLPCVDLWQVALDVVSDHDRGPEQAGAIRDYLLSDESSSHRVKVPPASGTL